MLQLRDQYFTCGSWPLEQEVQFKVLLHSNGKVSSTCVWRENGLKKVLVCSLARFPRSAEEHA